MNDAPDLSSLTPLQRAVLTIRQLRGRLDVLEQAQAEPIAIIGVGCRFPGDADTPDAYWRLLEAGDDIVGDLPADRWDIDAHFDPDPAATGKIYTRRGYFLRDIDQFDAEFFGLSPREANSLDPQHRLLLEVAWEALEHAGQTAAALVGSRTGVFVGIGQNDYAQLQLYAGEVARIDTYDGTGNGFCFSTGRLGHILGLQGPNLAIDTACSSSLVAVHLACQSLRARECDLALAGGVQLILSPEVTMFLSRARALAPDGRCKTFNAAADGYGRGEGCGVVALRRLSDAVASRDAIVAVIRGSAVNHNGPGSGLTVPSGTAQQALLRDALAAAQVAAGEVDYIEAHGTGTAIGDPIELRSLDSALNAGRAGDDKLLIGSAKTNIGHLEAAAGMAGLIKTALALQHGSIPASLHCRTPTPAIAWDTLPIRVVGERTPWPQRGSRRIAGVSSFGISGTNAHVVLEVAPETVPAANPIDRTLHVLTLSAKTDAALRAHAGRFDAHLASLDASPDPADLADVCFTANAGRVQHRARLAVMGDSAAAMREQLAGFIAGAASEDLVAGNEHEAGPIAWLFTGQGSQYAGMGGELYRTQPTFRRAVEKCEALLRPELPASLLDVWFGAERGGSLDGTGYTQPALFVLQYALAELWESWGIRPSVMLGHSVGEYVAACRAGVFSLEHGLRLIAARGRLMQALPRGGLMAAVMAPADRIVPLLAVPDVSVAALNGPRNTVLSGAREAVEAVLARLAEAGIASQPLRTSHAFHSSLMEPMLGAFGRELAGVPLSPAKVPLISNLTGEAAGEAIATPEYWCRHAREPVQFAAGFATLIRRGCRTFMEIGPSPVLLGMGRQMLRDDSAGWLPSLRPGASDWRTMLTSLSRVFVQGSTVDWEGFDCDYARRRVRLPTYPFQRRRHWVAGTARKTREVPEPVSPDWFHRTEWLPAPALPAHRVSPIDRTDPPGCWLLLGSEAGCGELAGLLERRGHRCLSVPKLPASALAELCGGLPLRGVVYCCDDAATPQDAETLCAEILASLRLLDANRPADLTPGAAGLWVLTRGAVPAGASSDRLNLAHAAVWGLGRSIALERPELWRGLIDLDSRSMRDQAELLLAELCRGDGETEIALRSGARQRPRLVACAPATEGTFAARADASYLITGGLGGLGLEIAKWLVHQGAVHLVLAGRSAPSKLARDRIAALEARGAEVLVMQADIADRTDLRGVFDGIAARMPQLRGVFHAAGIQGRQTLEQIDQASLVSVLRAKLAGTRLLDEMTTGLDLDVFVCFSSIAALWGGKGQAHYAAANHVLDAFAHDRRARGLPALTVNWGPWTGNGMVTDADRALLKRMGISGLTSRQNLAALGTLVGAEFAQAAVVAVDWAIFKPLHAGRSHSRLLEDMRPPSTTGQSAPASDTRQAPLRQVLAAAAGQRRRLLVTHLQQEIAQILRFPAGRLPDPGEGFFQLGMDSLMALELRNRVAEALGQDLPASAVFDRPTADSLAGLLLEGLESSARAVSAAPDSAAPEPAGAKWVGTGPVAIVGMACRFPGGADDPELFWQALRDGRDATRDVPSDRWDADACYDATGTAPGTAYTRRGGFLDGIDLFDAEFFGISPREAADMDPQHRLLLEQSHAALENAGTNLRDGRARRTGVFVGLTTNEYAQMLLGDGQTEQIGTYFVTGTTLNAAAGRLSYALGLQGPSLVVDTACSSSLVAVHLACRSLRDRECDAAIAAGVNLMLTPAGMVAACRARMLSPDGRCKTFDAAADGYARGEGAGVVVLKRLSDAVAAGDRIWAVIRGTAVNQDGRSSGFTVPNGQAQQAVIREALERAGVAPHAVGYVEAHGTGTALGDPIEVGALGAVFGADREAGSPLLVGSVKSNIGHLESAAGIAGLIKSALMLHHAEIPRLANLREPNPEIAWDRLKVRAVAERLPWPGTGRRFAGVSAFGISGTNAHAVLEQAPEAATAQPGTGNPVHERRAHLLAISAKSPEALRRLAADLASRLDEAAPPAIADVCFTLAGRSAHAHRAAWVVGSINAARQVLGQFEHGTEVAAARPRIAFLCSGETPLGAGADLYATQPVFRAAIDRVAARVASAAPDEFVGRLFGDKAARGADATLGNLAAFALDIALAELWRAWGVQPDRVVGAGAGCCAAKFIEGGVSLDDALAQLRGGDIDVAPERLAGDPCDVVIELGPSTDSWPVMLDRLAALFLRGVEIDLRAVDRGFARHVVSLPTYPFLPRRHWLTRLPVAARAAVGGHPLLGRRIRSAIPRSEIEFESSVGLASVPLLAEHRVLGACLLPASAYLEMAMAASGDVIGNGPVTLMGFAIGQPAVLGSDRDRDLRLVLRPQPGGNHMFELLGSDPDGGEWVTHASGSAAPADPSDAAAETLAAIRCRVSREQPVGGFLERLRARGIELGGQFLGLHRLWIAPGEESGEARGEALGEIRLPPRPDRPGVAAFRIHPALLDTCFQVVGATFREPDRLASWLQVGIDRFTLHAPPGHHVFSYARMRALGSPCADLWLFAPDGTLCAEIEGLRLKAVAEDARADRCDAGGLYKVQWQMRALAERGLHASSHLPSPGAMQDALLERQAAWRGNPRLVAYGPAVAAIEAACARLAAHTLHALGWSRSDGPSPTDALLGRLGVAVRHRRLFGSMLAMAADQPGDAAGDLGLDRLRHAFPDAEAEFELLARVPASLQAVLRGERDGGDVLFADGSLALFERLYRHAPIAAAMNAHVGGAIAAVAAIWPKGRRLRILEIGGGTGATTQAVLPHLPPGQTEYVFTDVSDVFTRHAASAFANQGFVRCALLDIEQPPAGQGFAPGSFDLVIAANVLHAVADLGRSLRHVRQLLAPGGMAVLLEATEKLRFLDLTFGLTEGWWRFAGDPARPDHPLINVAQWRAMLAANGFDGFSHTASDGLAAGPLPPQAVMTARAAVEDTMARAGREPPWLILADHGGAAAGLDRKLRGAGHHTRLIERAEDFALHDHLRLLADNAPLSGVIDMRHLDVVLVDADADRLPEQVSAGARSVLHLAQALVATPAAARRPLWIVTRGAVDAGVDGASLAGLANAPLWGLAKVLAGEHGELPCRLADIDPASADLTMLADEICADEGRSGDGRGETHIAFRDGRRHVARLVQAVPAAGPRPAIRGDRSYLVTGGLGEVGRHVAGWLVAMGARHITLLGRTAGSAEAQAAIRALEADGVRILAVQADVSQPLQLAAALARLEREAPPLAGIVHAAGVVADGLLIAQTPDMLAAAFAPKVAGAWALHRLTRHLPLDFFVLFGSASTLLGGAGLAGYAAANEFLPALAAYRRRLGLQAVSIDWGPWSDTGMARRVGSSREAEWLAAGIQQLRPAYALAALADVLAGPASRVGVMEVDWERLRRHPSTAALAGFLELLPAIGTAPVGALSAAQQRIEGAPPEQRRQLLLAHVRAEAEAVLGWPQGEHITPTQGFFDLGMDSLQANELRNRLQASLGCTLPSTLTFRFPTTAELADHLARDVFGTLGTTNPAIDAPAIDAPATDAPAIDSLAAEPQAGPDVTAIIRRELAELERLIGS